MTQENIDSLVGIVAGFPDLVGGLIATSFEILSQNIKGLLIALFLFWFIKHFISSLRFDR